MLKFILGLLAGAVVVAGVAVAGLLALDGDHDGNGGSAVGTTPGSTGSGETADDVLQRAADASSLVRSFHFVLLHENGSTPLPLNLSLDSAEGDVVVP